VVSSPDPLGQVRKTESLFEMILDNTVIVIEMFSIDYSATGVVL